MTIEARTITEFKKNTCLIPIKSLITRRLYFQLSWNTQTYDGVYRLS